MNTPDSARIKHFVRPLLIGLLACGAVACSITGECRTSGDCRGADECYLPDPPGGCGIPCQAERQCEAGGCEAGMACVETVANCCFDGELSSQCIPSCEVGDCAAGERCGPEGACEVIPCTEDLVCPEHHACEPAAVTQRANGCVRNRCLSDADCGAGYCVEGTCWEVLGQCGEVMLIP